MSVPADTDSNSDRVPDPVVERLINRFLECAATDLQQGRLRPLSEYQSQFPGHEERLEREYSELTAGSRPGQLSPAGRSPDRVGPYQLIRPLGRGGQGVVYLCRDTRYAREVALKLLPGLVAGGLPARVLREVRALARVDHPGVGVVYEAGEADGQAFVAMRYIEGETLADLLRRESAADRGQRGLDLRRRILLIEKVARALHAAHEAGVLHRDVKPSNILLQRKTGDPVLVDFGLAYDAGGDLPTLTRTGDVLGTTPYLSPERLRGEGARDRRADVWSLGVVLYEAVVGRRPFEGPTVESIARRIEVEEPRNPRRLVVGLSRDLAVVIRTALEKNLDRRYPTALALAEELRRVRLGHPVRARPVGVVGRVVRWARRNRAAAALLALLTVGLLAALLVAKNFSGLAQRERRALRVSRALLVRSKFEQAQLMALSDSHGRRWRMLATLAEAGAALRESGLRADPPTGPGVDGVEDLPDPTELRTLALEAILLADARLERVVQSSSFGEGHFDRSGETIGLSYISADFKSYGVRTLDVRTGAIIAQAWNYDLISTVFTVALDAGGVRIVTPRRDLGSIDIWNMRQNTRVHAITIPAEIRPREQGTAWCLALLPDGLHVAGVVGPKQFGGPAIAGFLLGRLDRSEPVLFHAEDPFGAPWLALDRTGDRLLAPAGATRLRLVTLPAPDELLIDVGAPVLRAALLSRTPGLRIAAVCRRVDRESDLLVLLDLDSEGREERRQEQELGFRIANQAPVQPSPDGSLLLLADREGGVRLVDSESGQPRLTLARAHRRPVSDLRLLHDGRLVTHCNGESTLLFELHLDAGLARPLARMTGMEPEYDPLFSEDGELALLPFGPNAQSARWLHQGGLRTLAPERVDSVPAAAPEAAAIATSWIVSSDGRRAARLSANSLSLFEPDPDFGDRDRSAATRATTFTAPALARFAAAALPGKGGCVVVQVDQTDTVLVRELERSTELPLSDVSGAAWFWLSADGKRLLVVPTTGARPPSRLSTGVPAVLDLKGGDRSPRSLAGFTESAFSSFHAATFSADGRFLAAHVFLPRDESGESAQDNHLVVWDLRDGSEHLRVERAASMRDSTPAISADGRRLAFLDGNGRVRLFDLEARTELVSWSTGEQRATGIRLLELVGGGRALLTWSVGQPPTRWDLRALAARLRALDLGW